MTDGFGERGSGTDQPPTVMGSRVVHDGFVRVRLDRVRLPTGTVTEREVVEHPGAVAILALTDDDHVLLVRQWRHPAGRFLLEIPAGTREAGEPIETTARRELVEEIGYEAGALMTLTTVFASPGYSSERITLVRADGCRKVTHESDPDEGVSLVHVPVASVPELLVDATSPVEDGKTLVALLWLLRGDC